MRYTMWAIALRWPPANAGQHLLGCFDNRALGAQCRACAVFTPRPCRPISPPCVMVLPSSSELLPRHS